MTQHIRVTYVWLASGVLGVATRSIPGWYAVTTGGPTSAWLPHATLAALWGVLAVFGSLDAASRTRADDGDATPYRWGVAGTLAAIALVGLAFLTAGYDPASVGLDTIGAPLVLVLWIAVDRRMTGVPASDDG